MGKNDQGKIGAMGPNTNPQGQWRGILNRFGLQRPTPTTTPAPSNPTGRSDVMSRMSSLGGLSGAVPPATAGVTPAKGGTSIYNGVPAGTPGLSTGYSGKNKLS